MHIALIGGLGTGKTTTAKRLCELVEDSAYIYMSRYSVRIPMALIRMSHPNLLDYTRDEYINTILSNLDIPEPKFSRPEMDAYGTEAFKKYGSTVGGEIALAVVPAGKIGILDGVARVDNIEFMKRKGVYIVGLACSFETQVQRRLAEGRDIDPKERSAMEKQIRDTEKFYEMAKCMPMAHIIYDTGNMNPLEVAQAIAPAAMATR